MSAHHNYLHFHARSSFFNHCSAIRFDIPLNEEVDRVFEDQNSRKLSIAVPEWDPTHYKSLAPRKKRELRKKWRAQSVELNHLWIKQMTEKNRGLIEKMALFWHGHFACRTIDNPYLTMEMNNLLREHALGNFRDMLYAVSKSAAMIRYLHLKENKKDHPNEDFARELCELFTLGRDVDYTEKDIKAIARAFTGWTHDPYGRHFVNEAQHDHDTKTIFGKTANYNGEQVLEMLLNNKNTARHIARKVYRFFVQEEVNAEQCEELANVFYESDYNIKTMMKYLFKAEWFYQSQGKLIKSPIELMVGMARMFDLELSSPKTVWGVQHYLGQVLFDPPNVAGWPGGRQWIDASRLALRVRLGSLILNKGLIQYELSPALDEMIDQQKKKKDLKFYEQVDLDQFRAQNQNTNLYDVLIRPQNPGLRQKLDANEDQTIVKLISTPDFQLT